MRFAERNIASSFELAERLVRAKNPQEVMVLHTDYVKSRFAALGDHARELTKQAAKLAA
jgi:phasin family protein